MAQPSFPLPDYLQAQEELFRAATRQLQSRSAPQSLSEAAEWLPDNLLSGPTNLPPQIP